MAQRGRAFVVAIGVVATLVAAGCGGGGDEGGTPEPSPEPTVAERTMDELEQALPTDDQLPEGASDVRRCPGGENCFSAVDGSVGVVFAAPPPKDLEPTDAEGRERVAQGVDWTQIRVVDLATEAELDEQVTELRSELAELDGEFDTEAERVGEGFAPGQQGTGTLADQDVQGWTSLQHVAEMELSDLDGESLGPRTDATLVLWSGTMKVEARTYLSAGYSPDEAESLVRTLVQEYLERLDAR